MSPSRRTSPRNFQHGQWLQSQRALCSEESSTPIHLSMLCGPSLSHGSGYTACSVCSEHCFIFLCFSSWCSLCSIFPWSPYVPKSCLSLEGANSNAIPLQFPLISRISAYHCASHKWSSFILNSQYFGTTKENTSSFVLQLCFTLWIRI